MQLPLDVLFKWLALTGSLAAAAFGLLQKERERATTWQLKINHLQSAQALGQVRAVHLDSAFTAIHDAASRRQNSVSESRERATDQVLRLRRQARRDSAGVVRLTIGAESPEEQVATLHGAALGAEIKYWTSCVRRCSPSELERWEYALIAQKEATAELSRNTRASLQAMQDSIMALEEQLAEGRTWVRGSQGIFTAAGSIWLVLLILTIREARSTSGQQDLENASDESNEKLSSRQVHYHEHHHYYLDPSPVDLDTKLLPGEGVSLPPGTGGAE